MNEHKPPDQGSPEHRAEPMPPVPDLAQLVRRIVDSAIEFQDAADGFLDENGQIDDDRLRDEIINAAMGLVGLNAIDYLRSVIGPPIEQQDHDRLARSPVKSRDAGDRLKDDAITTIARQAYGWLKLVWEKKPEGDSLRIRESVRMHLTEILALPKLNDDPAAWGKVIAEITWDGFTRARLTRASGVERAPPSLPIWMTSTAILEPGGAIYENVVADAQNAYVKRKRGRTETFLRNTGVQPAEWLLLDDAAKLNRIEERSLTPEDRDKAAPHADRFTETAKEIEAMGMEDGDLKEALRDRIVERLRRMLR